MSAFRYAVMWWLRWHLPVSRQAALQQAEQQSQAYFEVLSRRCDALLETLEPVIAEELHAKWDAEACQPPAIKRGGLRRAPRQSRLQVVKSGMVTESAGRVTNRAFR